MLNRPHVLLTGTACDTLTYYRLVTLFFTVPEKIINWSLTACLLLMRMLRVFDRAPTLEALGAWIGGL